MNAIDQAKKHFHDKEIIEVVVPEWGDESGPLVIYGDPPTLREKNRVKKRSDKDGLEALAFAVILKAKDKDGEKLFTIKDLNDLVHNVDPDVLARVAGELLGTNDDGEPEKKS